jgi:hypothetical protein
VRKTPVASKKQIPALLSAPPPKPKPDALITAATLQTMIFSGTDKALRLLKKPFFTPPSRPDALTTESALQSMIFSGADKVQQKPVFTTPPSQPDAPATTSAAPTTDFSDISIGSIEPYISPPSDASTVQSEPAPALVVPERDDRIVVEPPYPGSSPIPTQLIRESIRPSVFAIGAIVLVVFLGVFLLWNSGRMNRFPEDGDTPPSTLSLEPLHDTDPALTLSTPASPEENTPKAFTPEPEHESGSRLELMSIPSLPMNQQQGRHNRHDLPEITDDKTSSSYQPPMPVSPTSASTPE